jgi:hypothetical protein
MSSINLAGLLGYRPPNAAAPLIFYGNPAAGAQYLPQIGTRGLLGYNGQTLSPEAARFAGGMLIHGPGSPIAPPTPAPPTILEPPGAPDGGGGNSNGPDGSSPPGGSGGQPGSDGGLSGTTDSPSQGDNLHSDGLAVDTTGGKSVGERITDRIEGKLGIGPGNHMASTLGTLSSLGARGLGLTGPIGTIGGLVGTGIDAFNEASDRNRVGMPGLSLADIGLAGLNSITGGLLGRDFDESLGKTDLSGSKAVGGLNTDDADASNSGNASGGKNGVGESAEGVGTGENTGGKNGVGETAEGYSGTDTFGGGNTDKDTKEGGGGGRDSGSFGGGHDTESAGGAGEGGDSGNARTGGLVGQKATFAGKLRGPGTGTSDGIKSQTPDGKTLNVSNGEFVDDAKTTEHFGPKFFGGLKAMAHGNNGQAVRLLGPATFLALQKGSRKVGKLKMKRPASR